MKIEREEQERKRDQFLSLNGLKSPGDQTGFSAHYAGIDFSLAAENVAKEMVDYVDEGAYEYTPQLGAGESFAILNAQVVEGVTDYLARLPDELELFTCLGSRTWRYGVPPDISGFRVLVIRVDEEGLLSEGGEARVVEVPKGDSSAAPFQPAAELRDLIGLTSDECARVCGVGRSTFYNWLSGESRPRGQSLKRLLSALSQLKNAKSRLGQDQDLAVWLRYPVDAGADTPLDFLAKGKSRVFRGLVALATKSSSETPEMAPGERSRALERLSRTPRLETEE